MSLAQTRGMMRSRFGDITPEGVAAILHTTANDWTKIAVLSVDSAPARFHSLNACAEMITALAMELDAYFDRMADAHAEAADASEHHVYVPLPGHVGPGFYAECVTHNVTMHGDTAHEVDRMVTAHMNVGALNGCEVRTWSQS